MKTYQLKDGDTLSISVNGVVWAPTVFHKKDFEEIENAKAAEVAAVLNRTNGLAASEDEAGNLVVQTAEAGSHTSLKVDLSNSTAAASLGLGSQHEIVNGSGLRAARLVSLRAQPFGLASGSEMTLVLDNVRRKIVFAEGFDESNATADDVVKIINAKKKRVADVTLDGRVMLSSQTVGAGSSLKVEPAASGKTDAAEALGFVGTAAFDEPYHLEPAKLVCAGPQHGIEVVNLTASPIELHLPAGSTMLPARSSLQLSDADIASSQLQNLVESGVVRLNATTEN